MLRDVRRSRRRMTGRLAACALALASLTAFAAAADDHPAADTVTIQHVVLRDGRTLDGIQHGRVFDCYDLATGHMLATITKVFPEDIVTSDDETINVLPAGTPPPASDGAPVTASTNSTAPATGHGLGGKWGTSYKAALASAKRTGRPLLILFTFDDAAGKSFDDDISPDATFKDWSKDRLVLLRIDLGKDQLPLFKTQDDDLVRLHHPTEHPQLVVVNQDGKELLRANYHGNGADAWLPGFRKQLDTAAPMPVAVPSPPPVAVAPAPVKTPIPAISTSPVVTAPTGPEPTAETPVSAKSIPPTAPTPVAITRASVVPPTVAPAVVAQPVVTPPVTTPPAVPVVPAPVAANPSPTPAPISAQTAPPPADNLTPLTIERSPAPTVPVSLIGTWVPDHATFSADPQQNLKQLGTGLSLTITATTVTYNLADQTDPDVTHEFEIIAVTADTVIMRAFLHRGVDTLQRLGFAYRDGRIYLPYTAGQNGQSSQMLVLIPRQ